MALCSPFQLHVFLILAFTATAFSTLSPYDYEHECSQANSDLPAPFMDLPALIQSFKRQDLNESDLVALSGGHTLGFAQFRTFQGRIYDETNVDPDFAKERRKTCPRNGGDTKLAPLDPSTASFDTAHLSNLVKHKGLLHSEQALVTGGSTDGHC